MQNLYINLYPYRLFLRERKWKNIERSMSLTSVRTTEEVWLTCLTNALSKETEEITGLLLLGDVLLIEKSMLL